MYLVLCAKSLHVEYAERSITYDILFTSSLIHEYSNLEYEHVPVQYRLHWAEYGIHIRVAASQKHVNTYSTCRAPSSLGQSSGCAPAPHLSVLSILSRVNQSIYLSISSFCLSCPYMRVCLSRASCSNSQCVYPPLRRPSSPSGPTALYI